MPEPEPKKKATGDLSVTTMLAASTAGAVATAAVSGVGIAGTLLGGAVFPVLLTIAREMVLRAADRAREVAEATRPVTVEGDHGRARGSAAPPPGESGPEPAVVERPERRSLLRRVRWRAVAVTGGAAVALVVGVFTVGDLVLGESPVADRGSTFFAAPGSGSGAGTETDPETDPDPADPESPAPTTTEPTETTTPSDTTTAPEEEAPEEPAETTTGAATPEDSSPPPEDPPAADPASAEPTASPGPSTALPPDGEQPAP